MATEMGFEQSGDVGRKLPIAILRHDRGCVHESAAARSQRSVAAGTLVNSESPQCVSQVWEINEADIQLTDALYPVAREAMRRGYYMPNRGSVHCSRHQCPHWRRCEQDFGGVVEA